MWKKIIAFIMCINLLASTVYAGEFLLGYGDSWMEGEKLSVTESDYYVTIDNGVYYVVAYEGKLKVRIPNISIVDENGATVSGNNAVLNVGDSKTYYVAVDSSAVKQTSYGLEFYTSEEFSFYLDTQKVSWNSTGTNASRSKSGAGTTLKGVSVGKTRLVAEIPVCMISYVYGELVYEYGEDGYNDKYSYDPYSVKDYKSEVSKKYVEYDKPREVTSVLNSVTTDVNITVEEAKKTSKGERPVPHNPFTGIDISKVKNPFIDVSPKDWYYESVMYLYAAGILNGMDFDGSTVNYNYFDSLDRSTNVIDSLSAPDLFNFAADKSYGNTATHNTASVKSLGFSFGSGSTLTNALSSAMDLFSAVTNLKPNGRASNYVTAAFKSSEQKFKPENNELRKNGVLEVANGHEAIGLTTGSYTKNPFTDVKSNTNYTHPILWAAAKGIVNGYGNGKFGPDDTITREQFCAILVRHAQLIGFTIPADKNAKVYTFTDNDKISSWAKSAVSTCQRAGIVQGYEDQSFKPQGKIKKSELAEMVKKYLKLFPD